jgi:glycosyltransferase involved in cell wall biosynthesis
MSAHTTVIIPAFNEAGCITDTISEALAVFGGHDYRILVIDDGSTDETYELVTALSAKNECISLRQLERNRGFGYALYDGLNQVTTDLVAWLPADGAYDPRIVMKPQLITGEVPLLLMFRSSSAQGIRNLVSQTVIFLVRLFFRTDVRNYSGVFVGRTDLLKSLGLRPQSTFFTWQVAILANRSKHQVNRELVSVRSALNNSRRSRAFHVSGLLKGLRELLQLWVSFRPSSRL